MVEIQTWWVLDCKMFGQKTTCLKGKKNLTMNDDLQKVPKSYLQSQHLISKIDRFFFHFFYFNLGDLFLVKTLFSKGLTTDDRLLTTSGLHSSRCLFLPPTFESFESLKSSGGHSGNTFLTKTEVEKKVMKNAKSSKK